MAQGRCILESTIQIAPRHCAPACLDEFERAQPTGIGKESTIGIMGMQIQRICEGQHASNGSAACTEHPPGHQRGKNLRSGSREHSKELAKKLRPCQNSRVHIDLLVELVIPTMRSGGRYAFVYDLSKSAA